MCFNVSVKVNGIPTTFSFPEKAQAEEFLEQEIHLLEGEADDLRSQLVGLTLPAHTWDPDKGMIGQVREVRGKYGVGFPVARDTVWWARYRYLLENYQLKVGYSRAAHVSDLCNSLNLNIVQAKRIVDAAYSRSQVSARAPGNLAS